MTVRPSTADRFAIIPLSPGPAPADAIVTGSMSAVMEMLPDTQARNDALEQAAKAVVDAGEEAKGLAEEARLLQEMAKASTVQMITDTIARVASRLDAYVARRDAEEEEAEAKRIQAELDALPDFDDPGVHENTGDLHALSHKDEHDPDDPTEDQAEFELPEPTGTSIPPATALEF